MPTSLPKSLHMIEHGRAVDEAIHFLKKARPLPALTLSTGMSRAAADHCAEQIGGQLGHAGNDRSRAGERISRYGSWSSMWGENIAYSQKTARGVVLALIIDDGIRSRGHRKTFSTRNSITPVRLSDRMRAIALSALLISPAVTLSATSR